MKWKRFFLIILFTASYGNMAYSQDSSSSDGLFQAARKAAFDHKDYNTAKQYCLKALARSPKYADIWVFLGRVYTWTDNYDSAKFCFETVLAIRQDIEDASIAYTDLEYWNNHYPIALNICTAGLSSHPRSLELLIRKAKILIATRKYAEANDVVQIILTIDKKNTAAIALAGRIKEVAATNKIGINYDLAYFDRQYSDPWHLFSIDYSGSTKLGSVTARINYANRFKTNGIQYEIDAYPHISKLFYSYVNFGYSGSEGIFPKYRAGFSLYANLPKSFEAEAGIRYLKFTDQTWIYTVYLGKYYKNWLFSVRTYLTPAKSNISQSYSVAARYYYTGSADNYILLSAGTGISPDDKSIAQLLNSKYKLISKKIAATWKFNATKFNGISISAGLINQEYLKDTKGNQFELGVSLVHRF